MTSARDHLWFRFLAAALAGVGRRDEAIELMTDLHRRGVQYGSAYPTGVALLTLGRLHGGPIAREYFEQAHETLESSVFRYEAALAQAQLGAALRRDNQRATARGHLRAALDYAVRNDVRPLAEQAQQELALTGARPRRVLVSGAGSLTPSEARIAGLAAEGMSNHEIAQHLFLTVKTVESHLAASYRKLAINSRRDLKAALTK
jgi:DNA-binding CsgD family transcriptional regulator